MWLVNSRIAYDFGPGADLPDTFDLAVRTYREQGFLHVPGVLSAEEVARFDEQARDLLGREDGVRWQTWPDNAETIIRYIEDAWRKSAVLAELALHPRIGAIAQRLTGRPMRLFSHEVLVKEPHDNVATVVHDDTIGTPVGGSPMTLTAWVALVDVPVEKGCLTFIPGSHLRVEQAVEGGQDVIAACPDLVWQPRITVPVRAGDCTFHHNRVVHMAGANETDELRLSTTATYVDAEATYQPTSMQRIPDLEVGQRLDGERYPLLTG